MSKLVVSFKKGLHQSRKAVDFLVDVSTGPVDRYAEHATFIKSLVVFNPVALPMQFYFFGEANLAHLGVIVRQLEIASLELLRKHKDAKAVEEHIISMLSCCDGDTSLSFMAEIMDKLASVEAEPCFSVFVENGIVQFISRREMFIGRVDNDTIGIAIYGVGSYLAREV